MSKYTIPVRENREWRVLVVDVDRVCLMILEKMLRNCSYQVTTCQNTNGAMSLLQEPNKFDIVVTDVYMPEMDGLEFVKYICKQTSLPVIAMSSEDNEDAIKEGFKSGACDYLIKPIRVDNVRHLWMNVYRAQNIGSIKRVEQSWSSSVTPNMNESNTCDYEKINKSNNDFEDSKCMKKRKMINNNNVGDNQQVNDDATRKKQRVIWTPELHHKFVLAVNQFGESKAVPKNILELMDVPGLTRENVASHLQKYRQYHKKLEQDSDQQYHNTQNVTDSQNQMLEKICPINGHNAKAHLIATSSLQFGGSFSSQNKIEQIMSFHQSPQPLQNMSHISHGMKFESFANKSMVIEENSRAIDHVNLGFIDPFKGNSIVYHPISSQTYSTIDSKVHLVQSTNYASENILDLPYNDGARYIEQLDHDTYGDI